MPNTLYFLWDRYHCLFCMGNWNFKNFGDVLKLKLFITEGTFPTGKLYPVQQCPLNVKGNPKTLGGIKFYAFSSKTAELNEEMLQEWRQWWNCTWKHLVSQSLFSFPKETREAIWGGGRAKRLKSHHLFWKAKGKEVRNCSQFTFVFSGMSKTSQQQQKPLSTLYMLENKNYIFVI